MSESCPATQPKENEEWRRKKRSQKSGAVRGSGCQQQQQQRQRRHDGSTVNIKGEKRIFSETGFHWRSRRDDLCALVEAAAFSCATGV